MKEYTINAIEVRTFDMTYVVHAETEEQARYYTRIGNIESEVDKGVIEVIERDVFEIVKVEDLKEAIR